jgi:cyclopropane fatty-acyl-phospholipid synthase-like methyltransferase
VVGEWADPSRVTEYLSREIPHRDVAEALLLDALPERVERFLDLGTGDGRLAALIVGRHSGSRGVAVDASRPMLARAAERFEGDARVELVAHDLDQPMTVAGPFDAVVSGLAIHHLSDARKRSLFGEIRSLLVPGGVFANLDLVASATARQHERFRRAIGRVQDDPTDQLAGLCEQLGWLRDAGFAEVDCHFKWLELALVVAGGGRARYEEQR